MKKAMGLFRRLLRIRSWTVTIKSIISLPVSPHAKSSPAPPNQNETEPDRWMLEIAIQEVGYAMALGH